MTWGRLRGALSIALVLALVATPASRLPITYIVVVFSVLVPGLTMVPLLRRLGFGNAA